MIKNYKIKLETLTPVHIGSGEKTIRGFDYYPEKEKIVFITSDGLIEEVSEEEEKLLELMFSTGRIRDNSIKRLAKKYEKELYAIKNKAGKIRDEIYTILKTKNRNVWNVYIPGSSSKGAIRTAIICDRIKQEDKREIGDILASKAQAKDKLGRIEGIMERNLKKNIFGKEVDILSSLIIRDSEEKRVDSSASVYMLNISISEGTYAHPQLIEAIDPGNVFEGEIISKSKYNWVGITMSEVKDAANEFASKIIEHEKEFYRNYLEWWWKRDNIKTDKLLESYEWLEGKLNNLSNKELLLNLGRHSGHHVKTGWSMYDYELLFDKSISKRVADLLKIVCKQKDVRIPFPKTRRAVIEKRDLKPLGWVKVRVYED